MSLRAVIWVSEFKHFSQLIGGHWPSTLAVSVPLMEKDYNPVKQCALFIHLHVPDLFETPLVSAPLVVCQLAR